MNDIYEQIKRDRDLMVDQISKHIVGQTDPITQILAAIFSNGHALIVGVPGLAKTTIVKCVAKTMALSFKRIQFTPDLMPSDITGTNIIFEETPGKREFKFQRGPIFANMILADEINRTPPKTQAALLEAMQEKQVTVGNETYRLPEPYFVIATQNPIEQEGTYPLPEAQLDRFMFMIDINYPSAKEEEDIYSKPAVPDLDMKACLDSVRVMKIQIAVKEVAVSSYVVSYTANLVRGTRPKDKQSPDFIKKTVEWGAGPRAGQHLIMAAKAMAAMDGRPFVTCEDIRNVSVPVLQHRISVNFQAQMEALTSAELIRKLVQTIPEPKVPKFEQVKS